MEGGCCTDCDGLLVSEEGESDEVQCGSGTEMLELFADKKMCCLLASPLVIVHCRRRAAELISPHYARGGVIPRVQSCLRLMHF